MNEPAAGALGMGSAPTGIRVALLARIRDKSWKLDVLDALQRLGADVTVIPDDTPAGRLWPLARDTQLLLWARTHRRQPAGDLPAALARLHNAGVRTAGLHFDLYWGLHKRQAEVGDHPFWTLDTVWTADGHPTRPWARRGVNHRWCPPAIGQRHLGRGTPRPEYGCDIAFVGIRDHHPEWPYRRRLVDWLEHTYGRRFRWFDARSRHSAVRGRDLSDLCATAKVIVGDSCNPGLAVKKYWSDRIPAILGRGGFLIHPHVDGMTGQGFLDGHTLATYQYGDWAGLKTTIDRWVDDPDGRTAVTDRAVHLVADRHLMTHRIATILREAVPPR